MVDLKTRRPLRVNGEGDGAFLILAPEQVPEVRKLLAQNLIAFWEDEDIYSVDGQPEFTFITLSGNADAAQVQRILDSVP